VTLQPLRIESWLSLVGDRPLAFIDLETTDAEAASCEVCELGVVAYGADKIRAAIEANRAAWAEYPTELAAFGAGVSQTMPPAPTLVLPEPDWSFSTRVNPGKPIHPGATQVHGIRDEDVIGCAGIESVLPQLQHVAEHFTVAGYNIDRFDLQVLRRYGVAPAHVLEVMGVWLALGEREVTWYSQDELDTWYRASAAGAATMPPRVLGQVMCVLGKDVFKDTLGAAHAALYGRRLEGAHGTIVDCSAAAAVMFGSLALQTDLPTDFGALTQLALEMVGFIRPGPAGPYIVRGRHAGETVENVHRLEPTYIRWVITEAEIRPVEHELVKSAIGSDAYTSLINPSAGGGGRRGGRKPRAAAAAS